MSAPSAAYKRDAGGRGSDSRDTTGTFQIVGNDKVVKFTGTKDACKTYRSWNDLEHLPIKKVKTSEAYQDDYSRDYPNDDFVIYAHREGTPTTYWNGSGFGPEDKAVTVKGSKVKALVDSQKAKYGDKYDSIFGVNQSAADDDTDESLADQICEMFVSEGRFKVGDKVKTNTHDNTSSDFHGLTGVIHSLDGDLVVKFPGHPTLKSTYNFRSSELEKI